MKLPIVIFVLLCLGGSAQAFHEIESFARKDKGGGNEAFFTGSPRFKGYDCRICHTKTDDKISIGLEVNRPELAQGIYETNTGYIFTVKLIGEHRGLDSAFNPNTFMFEIVDQGGTPVGDYLPGPAPVELVDERRVIAAEGFGEGENEWSFTWFSPQEAVGPLHLYLAMVDGDGAGEPELRWIDPLNDDVATLDLRLCPAGQPCPKGPSDPEIESAVHCGVTGQDSSGPLWFYLLLSLVLVAGRRSFPLALVALLTGLFACGGASSVPSSKESQSSGGFALRYSMSHGDTLDDAALAVALDRALPILQKRAADMGFGRTGITREGNEIVVKVPGENELSVADLRAVLPMSGSLELRVNRHEGSFMQELCTSLASDSRAGVMRIESGLDVWQDADGATIRQCYLAAEDRVAMLNHAEALAEGCLSRGDSERTRCVVSGRTLLQRYLAERGDLQLEDGYELVFESNESSVGEGEVGERYWRSYYVESKARLGDASIVKVVPGEDPETKEPQLVIMFDDPGKTLLHQVTRDHLGSKLAILINGRVVGAPVIRSAIPGGTISLLLGPTSQDADQLAIGLRSGALAAPLVEVAAENY